jgi:hypothetical protein
MLSNADCDTWSGGSRPRGPGFHGAGFGGADFAGVGADRGCSGRVICGGGLALLIARAYVAAGAGAGVELDDVVGDVAWLLPLVVVVIAATAAAVLVIADATTLVMPMTPRLAVVGGAIKVRSTSLSERNSVSSRTMILTSVATSSRTVGYPSMTVTMFLIRLSWNSSSKKGA